MWGAQEPSEGAMDGSESMLAAFLACGVDVMFANPVSGAPICGSRQFRFGLRKTVAIMIRHCAGNHGDVSRRCTGHRAWARNASSAWTARKRSPQARHKTNVPNRCFRSELTETNSKLPASLQYLHQQIGVCSLTQSLYAGRWLLVQRMAMLVSRACLVRCSRA